MRNLAEGRAALETVGLPAVLKPADAERQHGLFRIDDPGDLESHLHAALAESRSQEAVLERFVDGTEMNAVVVARDGAVRLLTLSDRLRPDGPGFGVAWAHVHPRGSTPTSSSPPSVRRSARQPCSGCATAWGSSS